MTEAQIREALADALERAHSAPLNKINMDHKGRRSLGTFSTAWSQASAEAVRYSAMLRRITG